MEAENGMLYPVMRMAEEIIIRRRLSGEDEHRVFTVRMPVSLLDRLERIAGQTNRSRNEVINRLLEAAASLVKIE